MPDIASKQAEALDLGAALTRMPASGGTVRVGLLLDGIEAAGWQRAIVEDLVAAPWVDVPVAAVCWAPLQREPSWFENLRAARLHRTTELYDRYERLNRQFCGPFPYAARSSVADLLAGADILDVVPERSKRVFDRFSEADTARLAAYDLDVVLRFGFRILKGTVLDVARHGVWSFHHGDPEAYRGGPSCFWELAHGERVVGVVLQRLNEQLDRGEVLYRSASSCPPTLWVEKVRDAHFRKSSRFVLRCLERLHRTGSPSLAAAPIAQEKPAEQGRLYKRPGNIAALGVLARLALRTAMANSLNAVRDTRWSIIIRRTDAAAHGQDGAVIGRIGDETWQAADPCLHAREGAVHCFFERMPRRGGKGEIAVVRVLPGGGLTEPHRVIDEEQHLSYPFVFEWQSQAFLVAESAETGGIAVWEAERYPLLWRRRDTWLAGTRAYDPTLLQWQGLWYLFVTIDETGGGANDELFVFVADTPLGPWKKHELNPVVSDCRLARPAGGFFLRDSQLIRPVQDCSGSYGRAINLCAIDALDPERFSQRVIGRIDPRSVGGSVGCHTVSYAEGLEALDLRRAVPNLFAWRGRGRRR